MIEVDIHLARDGFTLGVEFTAGGGGITGLFGHSGAGKTTLIHAIAGLVRPDRGRIVIGDRVLFDASGKIDVPPHRRRVGVVFQEHRLFPHMSVDGNLRYGMGQGAAPGLGYDDVVELLEIGPFRGRRINDLSGGERQRVALGRTLLSGPRALLMDEPLASLDRQLRAHILPFLDRLRRAAEIPMLYVSHDLSEILRLTDRLLVLDQGRLVGDGHFRDLVHERAVLSTLHHRGMTNVLSVQVVSHDQEHGISSLAVGTNEAPGVRTTIVSAALTSATVGERVHVSILPSDIALATGPISSVSIQNQLPGVVQRCSTHGRSVLVDVDIGGATLVAEVSPRSRSLLELHTGREINCLIKSHAIRYLDDA